tara:strand:+ start:274 stop:456 length:183 start_codon:yes stop_codon:yes gene_type:complete
MKTIQLELSDNAFKAINNTLGVKDMTRSMTPLDYAWLKVIEHIEKGEKVVTLQRKEEATA